MNKIIAIVAAALALSAPALDDTVTDLDGNVWARQGSLGRNDYVLTNAPGLPKTGGTMTGGLSLGTNELSFAGAVGPGDEYATNLWDRIRVFPAGLGSSIGLASMIWSYVPSAVSSGAWPAVSNRTAELIRSSSVSVDAYTRSETDAKLAAKADEFTEWSVPDGEEGSRLVGQPEYIDGFWHWQTNDGSEFVASGINDATEADFLEYDTPSHSRFTSHRGRVLRATDTDFAAKADEFTPWVPVPSVLEGFEVRIERDGGVYFWTNGHGMEGVGRVNSDETEFETTESGTQVTATRRRVLRTGDNLAVVMQLDGGAGAYEITMDNATLTFDTVKKYAETRNAVIRHGRGTYRVTYIGQNEMMWDCTGIVQGRVLTGMIHMFRDGDVVQLVEPRELVTAEVLSFLATNAYSVAIGSNAVANANRGIAIGFPNTAGVVTEAGGTAVAIGVGAKATGVSSVAIGPSAQALATYSVQLGNGVNNDSATLKFRGYTVVDSTGHIPVARLPAGGADVQADMLDGVYYRRLIYDGSVYYVAVTNTPPALQEQETDDPEEEVEP